MPRSPASGSRTPPPPPDPDRTSAALAALAALGAGTVVLADDDRVVDADATACALVGRTIAELQRMPDFVGCLAPEQRGLVAGWRVGRVQRRLLPLVVDTVVVKPGGERVPVTCAVVDIAGRSGDERLVLLHDRRASSANFNVLEQYRVLVQQMPVAVLVWNTAGAEAPDQSRLLFANAAADEAFGVDFGRFIGRTAREIAGTTLDESEAARTVALSGSGRVEYFPDLRLTSKSGETSVYRHRAVDLTGGLVAHLLENVTAERAETRQRRELLERLVDTGDAERRAIALGVHDDPIQQIAAAQILVQALQRHPDSPLRDERLATAAHALQAATISLRRLIFELSPPELVESGLEGALHSASSYLFDNTRAQVDIRVDVRSAFDPAVQTAVFRIAAEALTNVRKHADAGHVRVTVEERDGWIRVEVTDDGRGFEAPERPGHLGLRAMRERAESLGGATQITSGDGGTTVSARLPVEGRAATDALAGTPPTLIHSTSEVDSMVRELASLRETSAAAIRRAATLGHHLRRIEQLAGALRTEASTTSVVEVACRLVGSMFAAGCVVHLADEGRLKRVAAWHHDPRRSAELNTTWFQQHAPASSHQHVAWRGSSSVTVEHVGDALTSAAAGTSATVPLRLRGQVLGTITVVCTAGDGEFGDDELTVLRTVTDLVAHALAAAE